MNDLLCQYRNELMGIATIFILLGHTIFYSHGVISYGFLTDIITLGYSGVDIFLLLSGFGLVYSMKKNSIIEFYKRRTIRILPSVIGIICIYCLCNYKSVGLYYFNPLFWYQRYWYLGFIIIAYLLFPYLYKFLTLNRTKELWYMLVGFSLITLTFMYYQNMAINCNPYMCSISRIPIFCIGSCIAMKKYPLLENKYFRISTLLIGVLLLLPFYILNDLGGNTTFTTYYHFVLIIPPMLYYLCKIIEKSSILTRTSLSTIGKYSLEIYLIQVTIMPRLISQTLNHFSNTLLILVISILPVIIVSLIFHFFTEKTSIILKNIL